MLSAPLYLSTDLGNGCWGTRALLHGDSLKIECSYHLCLRMSLNSELELLPQLQKWRQRCYVACGKRLTTGGTSAALPIHWTITIRGKTRCVLLHFDSWKRCVCPLYKFLYAFKVVKLFLKHSVFVTKLTLFNRQLVSALKIRCVLKSCCWIEAPRRWC